ncbi:F-box domain containing protein [Tanacetum coccineum]|uniref:F-box domain containing protein n=1 Tax=Tanacetum coccineum TaxID=301880 RepID=A0ABQ5D2B1_9ASTR
MYDTTLSCIVGFDIIKSEEGNTILEAKKGMSVESELKSFSKYSWYSVGGSCNGLLYLSMHQIDYITSLVVIHPLWKEIYKLPPIKRRLDGPYYLSEEPHGLGFDVSTNTFKMVFVLSGKEISKSGTSISNYLCTMVHVLGMDSSWREIPQVPPYPTSGDGIYAHGCLYWLVSSQKKKCFICFDVRNEEFTLIYRPKRRGGYFVNHHQLVYLQGEVEYIYFYSDNIIEVWVLKQKRWVKHCRFSKKPPLTRCHIEVLGRWNRYRDLLIKSFAAGRNSWFVYSLKSRVLDEVNILGQKYGHNAHMYMYPASSMFSIGSIKKSTAHLIKADLNAG